MMGNPADSMVMEAETVGMDANVEGFDCG